MLAPIVSAVVRGIILNHLDVADQPRASISSFDQIVTQQSVSWEPAIQHAVERFHLVDSFSYEDALAIKILIDVGSGTGINVETGLPRINTGQPGSRRTLNANTDAGLQDAVACDDDASFRIKDRLIQWVR